MVWLLPILFIFLTTLGALFYSLGRYGCIIIAINVIAVVKIIRNLFSFTVALKSIRYLMISNSFIISVSIFDQLAVRVDESELY